MLKHFLKGLRKNPPVLAGHNPKDYFIVLVQTSWRGQEYFANSSNENIEVEGQMFPRLPFMKVECSGLETGVVTVNMKHFPYHLQGFLPDTDIACKCRVITADTKTPVTDWLDMTLRLTF